MSRLSQEAFQRTRDQKTKELADAINGCIYSFLSISRDQRKNSAAGALAAAIRLQDMLHQSDQPSWLNEAIQNLNSAHEQEQNTSGAQAVHFLAESTLPKIKAHRWPVDTDSEAVEFDAIFAKYYTECKIPELFDQLIDLFEQIIASGEIDSMKAIRDLKNMIATLQKARNGSYFATRNALGFCVTWMKNSGWDLIGKVPVFGSITNGLRKTLEDADKAMKVMHDNIQIELEDKISKDFPRLEYRSPDFPRLEHNPRPDAHSQRQDVEG